MPLGVGQGQNVGLRDFCHIMTLLPPGASVFHKHMSSITKGSLQETKCLNCSLSPPTLNRVGGDVVTRPFVGGWVSESVSGFVSGSVTLYLVDTIATTVFAQSFSNFTCTFAIMRGGTLLILGHGVKGQGQLWQGQLWHSVYKTLWAR